MSRGTQRVIQSLLTGLGDILGKTQLAGSCSVPREKQINHEAYYGEILVMPALRQVPKHRKWLGRPCLISLLGKT